MMSLPRRTPPSQMISTRSPTASATGATGRAPPGRRRLPTAVVRQGDRVDTDVSGDLGVLDRLDALDHDRPAPHRSEPLDIVPRQPGVELVTNVAARLTADEPSGWSVAAADEAMLANRIGSAGQTSRSTTGGWHRRRRCRGRASAAARTPPDVTLTTTEVGGVDGDHERLVPGRGGSIDHVAQQSLVLPDIHLEPAATVAVGGGDLLDVSVDSVDSVYGTPARWAARATANSPWGSAIA